jgi:hypothetical protein
MAETTADVRRDIELTRERMSSTIEELEDKLNVKQMVVEHPWPALAVAFGAGLALSGSNADVKSAAATAAATKGASSKVGAALDDIVASLMTQLNGAIQGRVDGWVDEIKTAIGGASGARPEASSGYGVATDRIAEGPATAPGGAPRAD